LIRLDTPRCKPQINPGTAGQTIAAEMSFVDGSAELLFLKSFRAANPHRILNFQVGRFDWKPRAASHK
jgi:hypothetical protein